MDTDMDDPEQKRRDLRAYLHLPVGCEARLVCVETAETYRRSLGFVGTVNADTWQGGAPGAWMCVCADAKAFTFDAVGRPTGYFVTYKFQKHLVGWQPPGLPPVYRTADFSRFDRRIDDGQS